VTEPVRPGIVATTLAAGVERLRRAGSESARLDAELLLGHILRRDRTALIAHPEAPVPEAAAATYEAALVRREAGEPVAYIRGFKEFHGLAFSVDPRALIPRPETELLVDLATAEAMEILTSTPRPAGTPPLRVADVGTGSGAVAVSLAVALRRRRVGDEVDILATDRSAEALQLARENAVGHGVADRIRFVVADLLPADGEPLEIVAANLPYVPSAAIPALPIAASFEPRVALDGGLDGLDLVRRLLELLPRVLAGGPGTVVERGGVALLEIGSDQADAVATAVAERLPGWPCRVIPDLSGRPRVVRIERPAAEGSHG
jgi:release factor glutamine methyltransferase